jgi:hypothetical protein
MKLWKSLAPLATVALTVGSLSPTLPAAQFSITPAAYNPANASVAIAATWSRSANAPSGRALTLAISRMVSFPPGASATAVVTPVDGLKLTHLGFDHKVGTYCTPGSPRWDVETTDGSSYAFGCAAGLHDAHVPAIGWERITFSCSDVQVLKGLAGSCPLGSAQTISLLQIVQDEAGSTTLADLNVNWTVAQ